MNEGIRVLISKLCNSVADDGPLPDGARLNDFLHSKNISASS